VGAVRAPVFLALALALAGCKRPERTPAPRPEGRGAAFDWQHPESSLRLSADESAARVGSFDWSGTVSWSVTRGGSRQQATERHRLRQLASGEFSVESDIDPGQGPGFETGKHVIWVKGMTYARSRYAASGAWRERPTDRGRDARRFREESYLAAADLADLLGGSLKAVPRGDGRYLGRPARRFSLVLDRGSFSAGVSRLGESPPGGGADDDTRKRLAFLDGREPLSADGELWADLATGVPLQVLLRAAFRVRDDPGARVDLDVAARITALGDAVGAVAPPSEVLPDERKPKGVARALEAAGLRKKKAPASEVEPEPEPDSE